MTVTARKVLADCKAAHSLLETESDDVRFRIIWVSGVALLRSVGHVLKGVDSKRDLRTREAVDEAWERWSSDREAHAIFWEFIQEARNNILKEYEFGFMSGPVDLLVTPGDMPFTLDENLFCPVSGGRYAGEDCRDVLAEGEYSIQPRVQIPRRVWQLFSPFARKEPEQLRILRKVSQFFSIAARCRASRDDSSARVRQDVRPCPALRTTPVPHR